MKRYSIAAIILISALALTAGGYAYTQEDETVQVIIGFKPHLNASGALTADVLPGNAQLAADIGAIRGMGLEPQPLFSRAASEIAAERKSLPAGAYPNLNRWARVLTSSKEDARAALDLLRQLPTVDTAYIRAKVYPASILADVEPANIPRFVRMQGYLKRAPEGLSAKWAWRTKKIKGNGVMVADIEGDWNPKHKDLKSIKGGKINGVRAGSALWYDHGTAELGLVAGTRNNYGITGVAYNAEILMFSIFREDDEGIFENIADALDRASNILKPGDVMYLPIEFRDDFTGGLGFAVEYYNDVFEAIQAVTAKGIIVVEAAGNGGISLDDDVFDGRFDRDTRDSGAIIVGAGGVPDDRDLRRLSFSNFGSRVDIQNWGTMVVSTGYGDLYTRGLNREYTASFNGTSSATGLTAGVCALLQDYARETLGRSLTPEEMRDILVSTGTPQEPEGTGQHIGPRPNLETAFDAVKELKTNQSSALFPDVKAESRR